MTKITNTYVLDKAKMSVLLLIMLFTCPLAFAQSEPETAKPLTDMEVVRKVAFLVVDKNGKSIYKKTLKNVFLYVFSNGQIQVGKKNFDQIVVSKSKSTDENIGIIREKEGVY